MILAVEIIGLVLTSIVLGYCLASWRGSWIITRLRLTVEKARKSNGNALKAGRTLSLQVRALTDERDSLAATLEALEDLVREWQRQLTEVSHELTQAQEATAFVEKGIAKWTTDQDEHPEEPASPQEDEQKPDDADNQSFVDSVWTCDECGNPGRNELCELRWIRSDSGGRPHSKTPTRCPLDSGSVTWKRMGPPVKDSNGITQ